VVVRGTAAGNSAGGAAGGVADETDADAGEEPDGDGGGTDRCRTKSTVMPIAIRMTMSQRMDMSPLADDQFLAKTNYFSI
jgi:hypothetical protein